MRGALAAVLVAAWTALPGAQQPPPADRYLADFDFFIATLIDTHPDPYSGFGNRVEFHRAKQQARSAIAGVKTDRQFVDALNAFVARMGDGHTVLYMPAADGGRDGERRAPARLPLALKAAADGLFVQNSTEALQDLIGCRVEAIEGVPVSNLLEDVARRFPTENASGAYYNLIAAVSDSVSAGGLFGRSDAISFTLSSNGRASVREIAFQAQVVWRKEAAETSLDNRLLAWTMVGRRKDIGYLVWNSVASREMVEEVRLHSPRYLEVNLNAVYGDLDRPRTGDVARDIEGIPSLYEQFHLLMAEMQARRSKHLVIDLRHNGGGSTPLVLPLVYVLYGTKFLEFEPESEYIKRLSPLYLKKIGQSLEEYNARAGTSYQPGDYVFGDVFGSAPRRSIEEKRQASESGYFNLGTESIKKAAACAPRDIHVTVLTSPETFSAAYHFLYFLRQVGGATTVGVASRQAGNAFMETTPFELPHTGIRGSISNAQQILFKHDPASGRLLRPDVEMRWEDYRRHGFSPDAELLEAVARIEGGRR